MATRLFPSIFLRVSLLSRVAIGIWALAFCNSLAAAQTGLRLRDQRVARGH